jgi:HD-GYP domain-containing protein (c-di-GMP phosphodiesterase class II)
LHDIGKLGIDEGILNKIEPLTTDEYNRIKQHPVMGYAIIQNIPDLKSAKDIILYHHERFDGKGYPNQLKEYQIPMLARVVAISDAFDAMITVRPYRIASMSVAQAIDELVKCAGTQFDPDFVTSFILALRKNG